MRQSKIWKKTKDTLEKALMTSCVFPALQPAVFPTLLRMIKKAEERRGGRE